MSKSSPAIGIDLGTTYCCVGYLNKHQTVDIIENREGQRVTPSYVAFTDDGEIIGKTAKEKVFRKPKNVAFDVKRLMGQQFDNKCMQRYKTYNWPFKVVPDDDTLLIEILRNGESEKYKPQEVSAILLGYMKSIAEERLDAEITDAVITVPAYFNFHQRTATQEAAKLAGLNVLKIINEPTAAALAYLHKNEINGENKNILVFDLGGGTFDVSIVAVDGTGTTVKATAGNTQLGGRDFDNNLTKFVAEKIEKQYKRNITENITIMQRISQRSEKLKIALSSDTTTNLDLNCLFDEEDIDFEISRNDFDQINSHLFQACIDTVKDCLKDADLKNTDIDKIVLVGGSTRIPKIQEMLKEFFEGKQLTKAINPDEAVAYGAALQAAMINKSDKLGVIQEITDVTPLSLGKKTSGSKMSVIIPRNSPIPISRTVTFFTTADNQTNVKIEIYEGERSLVQYNTQIGRARIKLPPKPPGYPFEVTFHVNANGILEVGARNGAGDYTNLIIEYEKPNAQTTNNILKDAERNRIQDNAAFNVVKKWRKLRSYCTKMQTLCDYDKRGITDEEKCDIKDICQQVLNWLYDNKVKDGSQQEKVSISSKRDEIENICEPIANSYGYHLRDMAIENFHELITQ